MLKNAEYIWRNIVIEDGKNTTKQYCKKNQEGIDLSLKSIYKIKGAGFVSRLKSYIPDYEEIKAENLEYSDNSNHIKFEGWHLLPGTYIAELDCGVQLGKNDTGLIILRSSLNRMGVEVISALWDSGYHTREKNKVNNINIRINVHNPDGFYVEKHARICQLIIAENEDTSLYSGQFQGGSKKSNL